MSLLDVSFNAVYLVLHPVKTSFIFISSVCTLFNGVTLFGLTGRV